jgi:hypothetical protein
MTRRTIHISAYNKTPLFALWTSCVRLPSLVVGIQRGFFVGQNPTPLVTDKLDPPLIWWRSPQGSQRGLFRTALKIFSLASLLKFHSQNNNTCGDLRHNMVHRPIVHVRPTNQRSGLYPMADQEQQKLAHSSCR